MKEPVLSESQESGLDSDFPLSLVKLTSKSIDEFSIPYSKRYTENFVEGVGFLTGAFSSYVMYLLSNQFGDKFNDYIGMDNETGENFSRVFFGITALIPMAALGAINVQESFKKGIKYITRCDSVKSNQERLESKFYSFLRILSLLATPFSAIPQSTLTWKNMENYRYSSRVFVTMTAVIGPSSFNGRAGQQLIDRVKGVHWKTKFLQNVILRNGILKAQKIQNIENEKFLTDIAAEDLLKDLLNTDNLSPEELTRPTFSPGKIIARWSGFLLGALASVLYYELTIDGETGQLDINIEWFQILSGILSYMLNGALSAIATQDSFELVYDYFANRSSQRQMSTNQSKVKSAIFYISVFFGIFAAVPLGDLQMDKAKNGNIFQKILIIPSFLGPFCIRGKALYVLLCRTYDRISRFLSSGDVAVIELSQIIAEKMSYLKEKDIDKVYATFQGRVQVKESERLLESDKEHAIEENVAVNSEKSINISAGLRYLLCCRTKNDTNAEVKSTKFLTSSCIIL